MGKIRAPVVFGVVIFSSACAATIGEGRPLTDAEKAVIAGSLARDMKDPDSARFRWMPLSDKWQNIGNAKDGRLAAIQPYCGMVSGKNASGGYVGFVPYLTLLTAKGGEVVLSLPVGVATSESAPRQTKLCLAQTGFDPNGAQ